MRTGKVIFNWQANILYVNAMGPFSTEQIQAVADNYMTVIQHSPVSRFKVIEDWDDETLGPPEGIEIIGKTWHLLPALGAESIAIVVKNELQKLIAEKHLPPEGKVFKQKQDALAWLSAEH